MSRTDWPADAEQRWPNFERAEVTCQCGCGAVPDPAFMDMLQTLRGDCGFGLRITSGARCPDHNDRVSGTGRDGPHTTGLAADIAVSGHAAHQLIAAAAERGLTGIGVKQNGAHSGRRLQSIKASRYVKFPSRHLQLMHTR